MATRLGLMVRDAPLRGAPHHEEKRRTSPAMTTSAHILPTLEGDVARVGRRVENILEVASRRPRLAALDGPLAPLTAFAAARLRLGLLAGDHDLGVAHMLLHQPEQNLGVLRMQTDA